MRQLLKTNLVYALGSAANSAALLLLLPFLVNALSAAEYGAWALYEIGILFLSMLMLAGFDIGLMRAYWALEDEHERRRLAGSVLLMVSLWSALLALGLWLLGGLLQVAGCAQAGGCDLLRRDWLALVLMTGLAETLFGLLLTIFRIRERAPVFAALSFGRLLLFLALAIAGVLLGGGLGGALAGRLSATLIVLLIALALARNYLAPALAWPMLRGVLVYGLPMLPANVAAYVLLASDRYVLQSLTTIETVAIYSFVYKVATGLEVLVIRPFALDWAPRRFKIATQPGAQAKYAEVLVIYLFVACGCALLLAAGAPLVYRWLAPPLYAAGLPILGWLLAAQVVFGATYPLNVGIMLKDRTRYMPLLYWISAAVCVGLTVWWVGAAGMAGAAWATLVAYTVLAALIAAVSHRLYPVHYSARRLALVALALVAGACGILAADLLLPAAPLLWLTSLKALWVLLAFALCGYVLWLRGRDLPRLPWSRGGKPAVSAD